MATATEFISFGAAAGALLALASRRGAPLASVPNWSGNQRFRFASIAAPASVEEVAALVRSAKRVKVVGSAHSFNASAAADAGLERDTVCITLKRLAAARPPEVDEARATVSVCAGATYGDLFLFLKCTKWALHNSASLPHISVGGAVATATHGSGAANGNLATAVVALELVTASGNVLQLSRAALGAAFDAYVVHLGAVGVVTRVTLSLVPAFSVRQDVFQGLALDRACESLDAIMSAGYSVSLFTLWADTRGLFEQVWVKSVVAPDTPLDPAVADASANFYGARRATRKLHPIESVGAEPCTEQLGMPGAWHDRLPHFKYEFQPSVGAELQSEFFVSKADAPAALRAVHALRAEIEPLLFVTEVRSIAQDGLWMSTAHGRPSIAIHFTWRPMGREVAALLPKIEAALAPFGARPHPGKLSTLGGAEFAARFPRFSDFAALRKELDPEGKFSNVWLRNLGLAS